MSGRRRGRARAAALAAAVLALAGCTGPLVEGASELAGQDRMGEPAGVGAGEDELRRSPCACIRIELAEQPRG